ncbi:hypothetical protein C8A05DRAFT_33361 [Staphylotrichum tortipilum]|uniref:Uncharacterized protein n=1 Tax=Staphylotrichum tortipilum TaxID=2831512 RepID=A0AAN6RU65_9PEZI|nr:hypothetical protein C8A05DRAFT_33361 [Staphylotrichum longicolle]
MSHSPQGQARAANPNPPQQDSNTHPQPLPAKTFTTAITLANTSFHASEALRQGKLASDLVLGISRCTRCGDATTSSLLLKPEPNMISLQLVPKPACEPFCLPCAADLTRAWLVQYRTLRRLPEPERRARAVRYLLRRCSRREEMVVADYFEFCRCCLNPDTHVSAAGECCEKCKGVPRCGACGVFKRVLVQQGEGLVCPPCAKGAVPKGGKGAAGETVGTARRADRVSGRVERTSNCERCKAPTGRALWKFCKVCREVMRCLPGPKCTTCKIQPRPEGYRRCEGCRGLDRKGAASRGPRARV